MTEHSSTVADNEGTRAKDVPLRRFLSGTAGQGESARGDLLTFDEAGQWLGLDRLGYKTPGEVVRNLCRTRRLRHVRIGKRVFIRVAWLQDYLQRESVPPLAESSLTSGNHRVQ